MSVRSAACLFSLAVSATMLSACDRSDEFAGPVRSETRQVASFDSIAIEGNASVQIAVGKPESLTIEGPDELLEHVRTQVQGETLQIKSHHRGWSWSSGGSRLRLKITVPQLASLALQGGNEVRITGFNGGESKIDIEGAADIHAVGRLDALDVRMSGAGNADLSKLVANDAKVHVSGVGSVYVHPKETLDATMNGVGAIFYAGSPREVNTHMNGLGTISQRDKDEDHADSDASPNPDVDSDSLQPEHDAKPDGAAKPDKANKPKPDPSKVKSTGIV